MFPPSRLSRLPVVAVAGLGAALMPYADPVKQREWKRRYMQRTRDLCPLCASLKWPESVLCQACRSHERMVAADLREREAKFPRARRASRSRSSGRPQPADHPWRKSLTRAVR